MMLFGGVYQKKYLNILEWSSLISLILLSAIYSCLFEKLGTQRMVTIISVSFALAKFIAVLVYHVFLCVKYFECFKNLAIKKFNHSNTIVITTLIGRALCMIFAMPKTYSTN